MGLATAKDDNHRMQERFSEVSQRKLGVGVHVTSSCIFLLRLFEVFKYMLRP